MTQGQQLCDGLVTGDLDALILDVSQKVVLLASRLVQLGDFALLHGIFLRTIESFQLRQAAFQLRPTPGYWRCFSKLLDLLDEAGFAQSGHSGVQDRG